MFGIDVKNLVNTLTSLEDAAHKVESTVDSLGNTVKKVVALSENLIGKPEAANDISELSIQIIDKLLNTPGMTQSRGTKFKKATPIFKLKDGTILKSYRNSAGVKYIFVADSSGKMLFGGYVGWIHSDSLKATLSEIKTTFVASEADTTQTPNKPGLSNIVREWNEQPLVSDDISDISTQVIEKLSNTPGIIQADGRDFKSATPKFKLKDGTILKTYKNPVGVDHVFLADRSGKMLFGGYVGWVHSGNLENTIAEIKRMFAC